MEKYLTRPHPGNEKRPYRQAELDSSQSTKATKNTDQPVPPSKKRRKPVGKESTIKAWQLDWIKTDRENDHDALSIHCIPCRRLYSSGSEHKRGAVSSDPFIKGTTNTKKSSALRHEQSAAHRSAYEAWKVQNNPRRSGGIIGALAKMDQTAHLRVVKLFDIAYHLARNELPFTLFPKLVELEKKHGVDLGVTYNNPIQARTFTSFIAESIRDQVNQTVKRSSYISVLTDGSTDRGQVQREMMYLKLLEDGMPTMKCLGIYDVPNANAEGLVNCIGFALERAGLKESEWKKHLVGYGADGASVNFGVQRGVYQQLKEQQMPWLVGVHCVAHRLELAVKDAFKDTYFTNEIDTFLAAYRSFYSRSPKRLRELQELANALEEDFVKPLRADGTRWVEHRRKALLAFDRSYPVVVAHLEDIGSHSRPDVRGDDVARAKGWLKKIKTKKFVLHMALYQDILSELSHLSSVFQKDSVSIPEVVDAVATSQEILSACDGPKLKSIQSLERGTYKGVLIKEMEGDAACISACRESIVKCLHDALNQRFASFSENDVMRAIPVLDPKNWPEQLQGHGDQEINILLDHFHEVLSFNDCSVEDARSEWPRLRTVVAKYHKQCRSWNVLWKKIFEERNDLKNIVHLIELIQVLPLSTSKVERAFSLMKRIKSDWRVSLDSSTMNDLMMIGLEGPAESEFDAEASVCLWWRAGKESRRPFVHPYGQRISEGSRQSSDDEQRENNDREEDNDDTERADSLPNSEREEDSDDKEVANTDEHVD